jgi:hypothetical protein
MSNITEYPVFEADQVLRSDHLNNMFNYLDEQERLTRRNLIGIGIVCGLDVNISSGQIHISKGLGVTSQGYMLQFDGGDYSHARTYKLPDDTQPDEHAFYSSFYMWRLFSPDTDNPLVSGDLVMTNTGFLQDKVVILFLEWRIVDLKNCTTADCDDKGKEAQFSIRPLLISQKDLAAFKYGGFTSSKANLPDVVLKRYNVPYKALKSPTDVLNAFYSITDVTSLKNIADAYSNVYNTFKSILTSESSDPFSNLFTTLTNQLSSVKNSKAIFTEYFYDYIDDLIKAYVEFREKGDALLIECCPDANLFPFHLALSEALTDSRTNISVYRNYFIHSPVFGSQKALAAEVQMLFKKMKLLIGHFLLPDVKTIPGDAIKITPSRLGKSYLSNRALPYYYNTSGLLDYWNYEKASRGQESKNLSYHSNTYSTDDKIVNPLKYELEPYNFFRIEGHIGKHLDAALAAVVRQKQTMSLPFDVIALNVAQETLKGANLGKCHFADLESLYNVLVAELLCKIHEPICFLAKLPYINLDQFTKTVGTINTGATPGANANADINSGLADTINAGGFTSITDLQNIVKLSTQRPILKVNLSSFVQLNQNFIDQSKLVQPYHKGTFLKHFCNPGTAAAGKPKTVGQVYLETIQTNATSFPKPAEITATGTINFTVFLSNLYHHIFYFIDTAEEMFATILPKYLFNLDFSAFEYKYKLMVQEAADFTKLVLLLLELNENNNAANATKLQDFIEDVVIDLVIDEMQMVTHICMDERIQQLLDEYLKRLRELDLERMFATYTQRHSGIDHKAGVPKGGTFILVYEDKPALTGGRVPTNVVSVQPPPAEVFNVHAAPAASESKATATIDTARPSGTISDTVKVFELNKAKLTEAEFASALQLIEKIQTNSAKLVDTFKIAENIVFADFYLPYMCCSDCAPISYIIKDVEVPPEQTTIKLSRNVICSNDVDPLSITVSPAGGVLSLTKVTKINDTTYQVAVSDLPVGETAITYTENNQTASDKITVFAIPGAEFTADQVPSKPGAMQFKSNATDTALQHDWNFGDTNSGDNNTSNIANPVHEYKIDAGASPEYDVTHTVSSKEGCKNTIKQKITVTVIQPAKIDVSKNSFCNNTDEILVINVSPAGGAMSLTQATKINETTYQVAAKSLPVGDTNINYTANGQTASTKVTVSAAPDAGFANAQIPSNPAAVQFTSNFTDTSAQHDWNFGDANSNTNSSNEVNPVHEFNFTESTKKFDVTHSVSAKNGCAAKAVISITLNNAPQQINETRVFCFSELLQVEDPAAIKSAKLLNAAQLKSLFTKFGISIDDKMQLKFSNGLTEVIQFTLNYILDNGASVVTKNVDVTVIGVNTSFNLKQDKKNIVFTSLATSPEKVEWKLLINNKPIQLTKPTDNPLLLPVDQFANLENMIVTLNITEVEKDKACSNNKVVTITRDQFTIAIRATTGGNF